MERKKVDSRLELSLQAQASLLSLQGQAKIGTKNMYLQARGDVDVGSVYAQATCIFNKEDKIWKLPSEQLPYKEREVSLFIFLERK